jgi:hypothetical protein
MNRAEGMLGGMHQVAFMQDDDYMRAYDWLSRALELFESHPTMALLGGRAGRLDTGEKLEVKGARLNVPGWVYASTSTQSVWAHSLVHRSLNTTHKSVMRRCLTRSVVKGLLYGTTTKPLSTTAETNGY